MQIPPATIGLRAELYQKLASGKETCRESYLLDEPPADWLVVPDDSCCGPFLAFLSNNFEVVPFDVRSFDPPLSIDEVAAFFRLNLLFSPDK